jgi:parallel beta-helix repeat protein
MLCFSFTGIAIGQSVINPTISPKSNSTETVEKNIIYVNPQTGNDRSGEGSQKSPLKTIKQALTLAEADSIIKLASGTYSEATGETFPLIIKNSVTIEGSPSSQGNNVIIQGSGYFISPTAAGQNVTIVATKEAKAISGITIINNHNRGHGLWIESANPQVSNNSFIRNGNTGLSVNGNSEPVITNNYFSRNAGNGLLIYGTSKPRVKNNVFENTGFAVSIVQSAAPTLIGNHFSGNRIGVILEGNSQATLRQNKIENSEEYGLVAIAQSQADLGTIKEPGNNIFRGNGKLDIQNASNNPMMAVGTEISSSTEGIIDFHGSVNSTVTALPSSLPKQATPVNTPQPISISSSAIRSEETLPTPKPISPPPPTREATNDNSIPIPPLPWKQKDGEIETREYRENNVDNRNNLPVIGSIQPTATTPNSNKELVFTATSGESTSETASSSTSKYRVVVEATDSSQQSILRSLYPDAFSTMYHGKPMLQIGVFSNLAHAEDVLQSLQKLGLSGVIIE